MKKLLIHKTRHIYNLDDVVAGVTETPKQPEAILTSVDLISQRQNTSNIQIDNEQQKI